jgi:hypothetical protein
MADHFSEYDAFNVPPEFRPLGAWGYFGLSILFSIPVLGLIFLIVFSFSDANINRRNYARSYFIAIIFAAILFAVLYFTGLYAQFAEAVMTGSWQSYFSFLPWVH